MFLVDIVGFNSMINSISYFKRYLSGLSDAKYIFNVHIIPLIYNKFLVFLTLRFEISVKDIETFIYF